MLTILILILNYVFLYSSEIILKTDEKISGEITNIIPQKYCIIQIDEQTLKKISVDNIKDTNGVSEIEKKFLGINSDYFLGLSVGNFSPVSNEFKKEYGTDIFYFGIEFFKQNFLNFFDMIVDFNYLTKDGTPQLNTYQYYSSLTNQDNEIIDSTTVIKNASSRIRIMPFTIGLKYDTVVLFHKYVPFISLKIGPYIIEERTTFNKNITETNRTKNETKIYSDIKDSVSEDDINLGYQITIGMTTYVSKHTILRVEFQTDNITSKESNLSGISGLINLSYRFR